MVAAGFRVRGGRPGPVFISRIGSMATFLYYLTTILVIAVVIVLGLGLWTMLKGRSPNLSQQLMRWRIALQFMAIVVIIAYVFVTNLAS